MIADSTPTKVIFRRLRDDNGTLIAVFPEVPSDSNNWYNCLSYVSQGGHSGADYMLLVPASTPVNSNDDDVIDLRYELERHYGYNLIIRHKESQTMRDNRRARYMKESQ